MLVASVCVCLLCSCSWPRNYFLCAGKGKKGKEEYLYSAILADTTLTKRSDMDHTVLPANYTMSAFPS